MKSDKPQLWSKDFVLAFVSNLLMFFAFYMLVPILPFYVMNDLGSDESTAGLILSLYTVAAIVVRPFSGYVVDKFSRKPLYMICYAVFALIFGSYLFATVVLAFMIFRTLHGLVFGLNTVSSSTLAIDIMPSERRGEGIGYFGMASSIAMAVGPMTAFWLYEHYDFTVIFSVAFAISILGWTAVLPIKSIKKESPKDIDTKSKLSFDRFILVRAIPCTMLLMVVGFGYAVVSNFVGLYCESASHSSHAGYFFFIFALGIIFSRMMSAKIVNEGRLNRAIYIGSSSMFLGYLAFTFCNSSALFYAIAIMFGLGMGYLMPGFQSMFVNLARNDQRGTANASFYTFLDIGMGIGIATGGAVIEYFGFKTLMAICAVLLFTGMILFKTISANYYNKNKIQHS